MTVLMKCTIGWLDLDETGFRFSKSVRLGLTAHPAAIIVRIVAIDVIFLVIIVHLSTISTIHAIIVLIVVASVV